MKEIIKNQSCTLMNLYGAGPITTTLTSASWN